MRAGEVVLTTITEWATPKAFFDKIAEDFEFTLDVCALPQTTKVARYFTPEDDGLSQSWANQVVWMNPPYGRGQNVYAWVQKAYLSARDEGAICVCLLPVSSDTRWFHDFVKNADEIIFVKDRIWFELNGIASRANHASMVVVFRHKPLFRHLTFSWMSNCRVRNGK